MNPKIISKHKFIRTFTFALFKAAKQKEFSKKQKDLVNTSLIPKLHQRTKELHDEQESELNKKEQKNPQINYQKATIQIQKKPEEKIENSQSEKRNQLKELASPIPRPNIQPKKVLQPQIKQYQPPTNVQKQGEYGKITMLLYDPSVSTIECNGPGTPLKVIRAGQKQITRITLSPEEINQIIETIADKAKVPLLEGVFKAAVDNFIISAIHSSGIKSRFIIKKSTPYALLENEK